jgi:energy-coupling factor transporter transmembrane protein EcfT
MRLNQPTKNVFWISVAVAVIALIAKLGVVGFLAPFAFWLLLVAFILLVLGNTMKGF